MPIQGLRDTSNFVADQRPKNFREGVMLLYPNGKAPLTALTSLMKSESVDDPEFAWWEKELSDRRVPLTASISSTSATTITISNTGDYASFYKGLKDGDLLLLEGGTNQEILRVNGDPSSEVVTVARAQSGSTADTLTYNGGGVNPNVLVIGSAYEQGSQAPTGVSYDPTKRYNYTQIFRNTLEMTRTASKTRLRTGDQVKEAKRECLEYHTIDMERAFFLGRRAETTLNGKPINYTGGIVNFIDSNQIVNATVSGAGMDMMELEDHIRLAFKYGSAEKMCFAGDLALQCLNQIARKNSHYHMKMGEKEYGMNVTKFFTPFGDLVIKTHPLFVQNAGGTTGSTAYYGMNSWMMILDMAEVKYRYLKDSDTKYQPDLEANGLDGMKSGYLTECGLEIHFPKAHYLIKRMIAGAADY